MGISNYICQGGEQMEMKIPTVDYQLLSFLIKWSWELLKKIWMPIIRMPVDLCGIIPERAEAQQLRPEALSDLCPQLLASGQNFPDTQ